MQICCQVLVPFLGARKSSILFAHSSANLVPEEQGHRHQKQWPKWTLSWIQSSSCLARKFNLNFVFQKCSGLCFGWRLFLGNRWVGLKINCALDSWIAKLGFFSDRMHLILVPTELWSHSIVHFINSLVSPNCLLYCAILFALRKEKRFSKIEIRWKTVCEMLGNESQWECGPTWMCKSL